MRDKFVADVIPKSKMMPVIEEWRRKRKEAMMQEMKYFM
jgi:hypothetical protein